MAAKKIKKAVKKAVKKSAPVKKTKKVVKAKAKPKAAVKAKTAKKAIKKPVQKTAKKVIAKKVASKNPAKKVVAKKEVSPKSNISKKANSQKSAIAIKKVSAPSAKAAKPAASLQNFMTPLDDRILVRLAEAEKMTAGGLYIPPTVSNVTGNLEGQIVSVGRGHLNKKGHIRPLDVKLGDKIVFAEYAGSKIQIQNEELIILRESDVMGVVAK